MEKFIKRGAGSQLIYRNGSAGTIEIYDIKVNRPDWRKGIGSDMIRELIETENPHCLYCFMRKDNVDAHGFYLANGFKEVAVIENFYEEDCKDAIMLTR